MRFDFDLQRFLEFEFGRIPPQDRLILPYPRIVSAHEVAVIAVPAARLECDQPILELQNIATVVREKLIAGKLPIKIVRIANEECEIAKNQSE